LEISSLGVTLRASSSALSLPSNLPISWMIWKRVCVCVCVCVFNAIWHVNMSRSYMYVIHSYMCRVPYICRFFVVWEMRAYERGKEWERGEVERVNMHARASKQTSEFVSEREVAWGGGRTGKREREGERKRARKCVE